MRFVMALMLTLLLAGGALAGEKLADGPFVYPELDGKATFAGILDTTCPTWDRGYGFDTFDGDCAFELTDSSYDGQYYAVFCIKAMDENPIEIVVDDTLTNLSDTTLYIFCDPFDPDYPMTNVDFFDDDDGEGWYSAILATDNVVLAPDTAYYLVLSTFSPDDTGDFVINTSTNVVECGTVATEDLDWGSLKATYK